MIKINFSYKYLLFFLALIALISFSEIGNSAPANNVPRTIPECTAPISVIADCETQPTTQIITFHKVALCTALPTEPTGTTATGLASCVTVFENVAGGAVSIVRGEGVSPSGTFTDPPYGNYTFAYVELSPVVTYKSNLVFNAAFALSSTAANVGNLTAGSSNCQTNGAAYMHMSEPLGGITCQDGVGVAVNTNVTLNSLDPNTELYAARFPGTNGNTDVYLVKTNGTLANGSTQGVNTNVAKLIAFVPMTANITPDTTSYDLRYNNTRGMNVYQFNNANGAAKKNIGFSIAYFDLTISVQ